MREIIKKPWDYTFSEKKGSYYLSVWSGSVGIFEIHIELNSDEITQYQNEGLDYIEKLAKEIQYSPSSYSERNLPKDDFIS